MSVRLECVAFGLATGSVIVFLGCQIFLGGDSEASPVLGYEDAAYNCNSAESDWDYYTTMDITTDFGM